ncbi:MAG: hypothetical protein DLM73_02400 [Chthoniobacterales bacterium]|nr:MAG: hypothetical protein DLM73_02400 [Chthoniobacterales bacterium]
MGRGAGKAGGEKAVSVASHFAPLLPGTNKATKKKMSALFTVSAFTNSSDERSRIKFERPA